MQTFLPFPDFALSAHVLDDKRLGKQRVETYQVMSALTAVKLDDNLEPFMFLPRAWTNHPMSKMWRGHADWLFAYQLAICTEWTDVRGFKDTCLDKTARVLEFAIEMETAREATVMPTWIGNPDFHESHRSNLVRKDPVFYAPQFEPLPTLDLPYVWPLCDCPFDHTDVVTQIELAVSAPDSTG
jgi:hypothetical protein